MLLYTNKSRALCNIFSLKVTIWGISSEKHNCVLENLSLFSVVYMRVFRYTKGKTNLPVQAGAPLYTRFDGFLTKTIREKELSTHESIYG